MVKGGEYMRKILIVEDDEGISDLIAMNLSIAGYRYNQIYDGNEAVIDINEKRYDLILLDIMLPGMDGFQVFNEIKSLNIPVIFLTAKVSLNDRVKGLKIGGDDYIIKPFEGVELLARIEAVLRRYNPQNELIIFNNLSIDEEKHIVKLNEEEVNLTIKEYELLLLLYKNRNKAISREKILEMVWDYNFMGESRTVDIHIQRLRKKLEGHLSIATVYKYGYRLETEI